ncbi:MAG TPA: aspartyl/glutamyl-tRNA amidotransferase subunit C [Patescibacteria group bacterium]|jgi:aspartyl/glutamyl-tRNA(Asn/Gln) amidotransferase C subunit|nr:aspartyl/glutamyl-tRNA amidotransferase subunit C [Patescibacteria group bacterium]
MAHISREELLKIATISNITLSENELLVLQDELQAVLSYAERVITVTGDAQDSQLVPLNVFRDDRAIQSNSSALLQIAPEVTDHYFVVPLIIE